MYFPLRADINVLQQLVDDYLNIAPGFAYFRAAMPYVLLTVSHYPKMGFAQGHGGWISQDEVIFMIPIEWFEPGSNGLEFKGPAQFSPFAFVDKDASQIGGREVHGWPKVQCWIEPVDSAWLENPRDARTLLRMNANGFRNIHAEEYDDILPLVDIHQAAPPALSTVPPDSAGILNPFATIARNIADFNHVAASLWDWKQLRELNPDTEQSDRLLASYNAELLASFTGNYINLKQLRDAEAQTTACYQAITNVQIEMESFNRGGALGDVYLAGGDLAGGYHIDLYNYPSIPIVETLGLEVDEASTDEVSRVRPVLPFWTQMDLTYRNGENIAWRAWDGRRANWRDNDKIEVSTSSKRAPYKTELGANFQVAEGPFNMDGAVLEVLPLMADRAQLDRFLSGGHTDTSLRNLNWNDARSYLPRSLFSQLPAELGRFEAWGDYVYMVVSHLPEITSQSDNIGVVKEDKITFAIPVKYVSPDEETITSGFVVAYQYSNNDIASTTAREVYGFPTISASVEASSTSWLSAAGPFGPKRVVSVAADMPASLTGDQPFEWLTLLDIVEGSTIDADDQYRWRRTRGFVDQAKSHQRSFQSAQQAHPESFRDMLGMAANLYAGEPLREFTFKQFRDADDPYTACYQAFVESGLRIDCVHEQKEIETPIHVNIHRYPTQPIVASLGLIVKSSHTTATGRMDSLQAVRPFLLRANLSTLPAKNLSWRTGTETWTPLKLPGFRRQRYSTAALASLDNDPACLIDNFQQAHEHNRQRNVNPSVIRACVNQHQPQAILGAILSREWGCIRNPRSASGTALPDQALNIDMAGPMAKRDFPISERLAEKQNCWTPKQPD